MNNLQYSQEEFSEILTTIIDEVTTHLNKQITKLREDSNIKGLIRCQQNTGDLKVLLHELVLANIFSAEITYYIDWQIDIQYKQIPKVKLAIHPVTDVDYYPYSVSPKVANYLVKYLIKKNIIPNPWKIS